MTTAELIQKRENQKNNPVVQQTTAFQPMNTTMTDADVATQPETTPVEQPQENKVSLYDVGKTIQGSTVDKMEQMKAGNYSPITTPEYERFRNEVIAARDFGVETEEQRKKRERADAIQQGLTGLTEGLTSLANLYYTTKWAPNQKLTSQMPELQQQLYRERLERDKKLENFRAWQRAKAEKDADRAYNLNLFNIKQEAENKAAEKKAKLDAQAAQIKYLRDLGLIDAKKEADLEKQKGKADLDKELESIRQKNRISLASINNKEAMNRVKVRGGSGSNATIRVPIGDKGEYAEYRKNDLTNPIVISQIYNSLPDEYRVRLKEQQWNNKTKEMEYPYDENPSTQKMQEAIGRALANGYLTEMAPEIQIGGETNKKKTLPGVSGNNKNNKHLNL